jgi:hypothetical protein
MMRPLAGPKSSVPDLTATPAEFDPMPTPALSPTIAPLATSGSAVSNLTTSELLRDHCATGCRPARHRVNLRKVRLSSNQEQINIFGVRSETPERTQWPRNARAWTICETQGKGGRCRREQRSRGLIIPCQKDYAASASAPTINPWGINVRCSPLLHGTRRPGDPHSSQTSSRQNEV